MYKADFITIFSILEYFPQIVELEREKRFFAVSW